MLYSNNAFEKKFLKKNMTSKELFSEKEIKVNKLLNEYADYKFKLNWSIATVGNLIEISDTLRKNALPKFKEIFITISGIKRFPKRLSEAAIFPSIVPNSLRDLRSKMQSLNYYKFNAYIFIKYVEKLFGELKDEETLKQFSESHISLLLDRLNNLYTHSLNLICEMAKYAKTFPLKYNIYGGMVRMSVHMWNDPITLLYGMEKPFKFDGKFYKGQTKVHYQAAIATIRLALEQRLRSAVCCFGCETQNKFYGIPLSKILDAFKKHSKNFKFEVDLSVLKRANEWTNMYIHSAFNGYSWIPYFVLDCLIPIRPKESIKMKKGTYKLFMDDIKKALKIEHFEDSNFPKESDLELELVDKF